MDFLTINDFFKVIQPEELIDVVGEYEDPTDQGAVILDALELDAIGEMTGYLSIRYDAAKCFDSTTDRIPIIIQKCVDIVLYNAYSAVAPNNIPKLRTTRYENAVNWLEKVASGFIAPDLPVKEDQPKTPLRYGSSQTKTDNFF
ncbi:MAG: DUF1320 family protein [Flavobacteriia bacterium]|nr:DUF1320 family protein [Flavobacteriia bacterium]OJX36656.1 MAG: hypothetical protein BGO87_12725 [Flavobacteriia bacterium 40-80]